MCTNTNLKLQHHSATECIFFEVIYHSQCGIYPTALEYMHPPDNFSHRDHESFVMQSGKKSLRNGSINRRTPITATQKGNFYAESKEDEEDVSEYERSA